MMLSSLRNTLTWLGGGLDDEPPMLRGAFGLAARFIVWALVILVIYLCSGQSRKFIYIDF